MGKKEGPKGSMYGSSTAEAPPGERPRPLRPPVLLLLLLLQSGYEHLFCPLVCFQVVFENPVEEFHQLLVALLLGILNVALERFDILRRLVKHGNQIVVLVLGLSGCFGHLVSLRWGIRQIRCIPKTGEVVTPPLGVSFSR